MFSLIQLIQICLPKNAILLIERNCTVHVEGIISNMDDVTHD